MPKQENTYRYMPQYFLFRWMSSMSCQESLLENISSRISRKKAPYSSSFSMDSPITFVRFPGKPRDTRKLKMMASSKKTSVSRFLWLRGSVMTSPSLPV